MMSLDALVNPIKKCHMLYEKYVVKQHLRKP